MTSHFRKFRLLIWKNWLLQRRKKAQTALEILFSIIFCILLVIIRHLAPSHNIAKPTIYEPFNIAHLPDSLKPSAIEDLFSSFIKYLLNDGEAKNSRTKRHIGLFDSVILDGDRNASVFNTEKILEIPKIEKYLQENPKKQDWVLQFLDWAEIWAKRKRLLYDEKVNKDEKRKSKRSIADWFLNPAWPIAYTPNTTAVREIMKNVGYYLYLDTDGFGFTSEEEMVSQLTSFSIDPDSNNNTFFGLEDVLGGIVFEGHFHSNGSFSNVFKYKIRLKGNPRSGKKAISFEPPPRWNTELTYPVFQIPGPRNKDSNNGGTPGYFDEGFLALQHAIDRGIADYLGGMEIDDWANVQMMRMPYPAYIADTYMVAMQAWLPLILLLSYLYPAINIVRSIVYEKENRLKESMKMMGLDNWLHWTAWYTKSLLLLLITTILITILLCTRWGGKGSLAVLDYSDPTLVFCFLILYCSTAIVFCFFLSTLCSKANSGATVAGIVWVFSYIPNIYIRPKFLSLSTNLKIGLCLHVNTAMSLGCILASMFEGTGSGLQWHLINSGVSPDSPFSIAHVMVMLVIDILLYSVLSWYIEAVFPGEFGVPLPWNFMFKRDYWCGYKRRDIIIGEVLLNNDNSFFEPEPVGLQVGIRVKGLTKIFPKQKYAVKNMHMNMYANQITVLLGHNGAGKTTTMSMLTGLFPPSRGTAEVNNYDIVNEMKLVRNSIGICPQHDILFDDMTVEEHIAFFSELKGLDKDQIPKEVNHVLSGIKLLEKSDALSQTLSGGMKRKLSIGIALCGGSRVAILDEPTSGMDPGARRVIWDFLQREKNGRTILLTTHFMEEADLLGDRIAIMAEGIVQCCGSSMFLKKMYGTGYHLIIVKDRNCDVNRITELIMTHIPEAEVELNIAAELTYRLPAENVANFELLFKELELHKNDLKISSYGASQTTMEEVFLKVGEASDPSIKIFFHKTLLNSNKTSTSSPNDDGGEEGKLLSKDVTVQLTTLPSAGNDIKSKHSPLFFESFWRRLILAISYVKSVPCNGPNDVKRTGSERKFIHRNSRCQLVAQQFWAMLVKKSLYTIRNLSLSVTQIFLPIALLVLAMFILRHLPGVNDTPPPVLSTLNVYDGTETVMQDLSNTSVSSRLMQYYSEQFNGVNEIHQLNYEDNFSMFLLNKAEMDLHSFNLHFMTGLQIFSSYSSPLRFVSYFNNQPYHVPPVALNLIDQALVRAATNDSTVLIHTCNHPLPRTDTEKLTQESRQNIGFNIGFNLAFGMSFLSASFVLFVIRERSSNFKHLQFVSGVNFVIYWLATALWDFLNFMVTCLLIILALYLYKEEGLSEGPQLGRILLVLSLYGWAVLPFMYISSFLFSIPSTGFSRMTMVHIFLGMATLITVTILRIPDLNLTHIADILDWAFLIFPPFAMATAVGDLYSNVRFSNICRKTSIDFLCSIGAFANPCCKNKGDCGPYGCVNWTEYPFGWEKLGVGRQLSFLAFEGLLFYLVIALTEMKVHLQVKYLLQNLYHKLNCNISLVNSETYAMSGTEEDGDVLAERQRIQNTNLEELFLTDKLIFRDLTKMYSRNLVAVDKLNLGVPLGECFGLLGINGAGKTTTFKMLTGDLPVSGGDAFVNGFSVKTDIKKVQQQVGYCPQFDALLNQMTGRETLRMFARLRGVPEKSIDECITTIADQLIFTPHLDKQVGKYSGGNKRKISTGIALIGDPPLVLLDEPTTGMDPVARRHLWDVLNSYRDTGRSIILTSHSMEECEALCTRLAIMTNGSFRCLGSPQHLKSKFAEGYSIIIRVHVEELRDVEEIEVADMPIEMARIQQFILDTFKESFLREMQWGRLEYFIPVEAASWAQVFGILEANRVALQIEDYSVTQTTLERVFLNFTRTQRQGKND